MKRHAYRIALALMIFVAVAFPASKPQITTHSLPNGKVGIKYSATLSATKGKLPYRWSLKSAALPVGLSLQSSGLISGTPTQAQTSSFTVQVQDSLAQTATANLSITISSATAPPPVITRIAPNFGVIGNLPQIAIGGTGFQQGAFVSVNQINAPIISITNTQIVAQVSTQGTTPPTCVGTTVIVGNPDGQTSNVPSAFTFAQPLSVSTSGLTFDSASNAYKLPAGSTSQPYSFQLQAIGGCPPHTWSITSGSLPPGIVLAADGTLRVNSDHPASYRFGIVGKIFSLEIKDSPKGLK